MILFIKVVFVFYVLMILFFMIGWKKNKINLSSSIYRVSVVIAIRNEQDNIKRLIKNLKSQDYNKDLYDVIIIDDHSEDNSWNLLCNEKLDWPKLKLLSMDDDEHGKKGAILKGVKFSDSEIIITTDADCFFSPNWITLMSSSFSDKKINFVSGPVSFKESSTIFSKIQDLEFISLVASGAGAIGINRPIFCNGANMAYRREVFMQVNDYSKNNISSGDDVFLLHMVKKFYPGSIVFLRQYKAIVFTKPLLKFKQFLNQRIRWASKSTNYKDFDTIAVSLLVFFVNISLLVLLILSCFDHTCLNVFILLFSVKLMIDFLFFLPVLNFFKKQGLIKWVLPVQILYPFYITLIVLTSNLFSFSWKGRVKNK
jgi:cellulose synthase/poly-beta-1,6-N-acetylglucosamine synthase-like glycosyltransferase